jgi:hypothetical protein
MLERWRLYWTVWRLSSQMNVNCRFDLSPVDALAGIKVARR